MRYAHGVGGKHFSQQGYRRAIRQRRGRGYRTLFCLFAGIFQHCPSEDIFGFGMGWDAEARHINADHADTI